MTLHEYIEYMLTNHNQIRESIKMIRRIMLEPINRDDIIEGLSMPGVGYDTIRLSPTNVLSNRAESIIDSIPREIHEHRRDSAELAAKIDLQEHELNALENAVSHISEPARRIILLLYYDGLSWKEVRTRTKYSKATLSHYRARGMQELVDFYQKYRTKPNQTELIGIELNS